MKPKYSKDMIARINAHFDNYFNAGGEFYNAQKYYPEAYKAFMIYGDLLLTPCHKGHEGDSRHRDQHRILQRRYLRLRR